ncbi:N,N-dimethylformamidase beta subunit family domain-containing protein [Streptomyces sporangiiformans]|uniref:Tachylectin 2 domain-containing protein n=1 Tax=Streptomyces sporangiiformans TaxID=2315329 RepID=A0A505D958_9ACTN|nr:N,N-dimethylformamidase beta subunit family domain-containing protein [Streptomyces sporangiiformans]TPQ18275.1 hypothetical protein FGD71_032085 [Streptomyces sporangiiformans]
MTGHPQSRPRRLTEWASRDMAYDPQQRFLQLVPGGNGIIYAIQSDGNLYWYRNTGWSTGSSSWANAGTGRLIGTKWQQFRYVLAAADGQIFAFQPNGDLIWYRYILNNSSTGAGSWHSASGSKIGHGWNRFPRLLGGWNNVLYGVDGSGNMFWYRYTANNGSSSWASGSGAQIGRGWKSFNYLLADPNGVIFASRQGGALNWYRYLGTNGSSVWANSGRGIDLRILGGYQKQILSNGSGTIYRVRLSASNPPGADTELLWYRLLNSETINTSGVQWVNNGEGVRVGSGFTNQGSAALQGYPGSVSTPQNSSLSIHVSTTFSSYTSATLRLAPASGDPVQVTSPVSRGGQFQFLQSGYRSAGCGWNPSFSVSVASNWTSGIYASQLRSPFGGTQNVPFVVRPSSPQQDIAVLVPTNTYNAYNFWGGHNQYTGGQLGTQRTVTLERPGMGVDRNQNFVSATGFLDHLLYSDLLLTRWMTSAGFSFDCYADNDLDATGDQWLPSYKALVLTTHPEYFTETMRQNVVNFQNAGGRLIYTGGNGIYEKVEYNGDRSAVVFRRADGTRDLFREDGQPESQILEVSFYSPSYMTFAPYEVQNNHAFLTGTGLSVGSTFGSVAYNASASGWEIDIDDASTPGAVLIAQGLNPGAGADMMYVPKPNGGWVFSASSLSFNGGLPFDAAMRRIMLNVLTAAVA